MRFIELPTEIQDKMLEEQVRAGNIRDSKIFQIDITAATSGGGFDWDNSENKGNFWNDILCYDDLNVFYSVYPKIPIKNEFVKLYKKEFKINKIKSDHIFDLKKIGEKGLEYILK